MIGSGSENFLRAKSDPRMKVNSRSMTRGLDRENPNTLIKIRIDKFRDLREEKKERRDLDLRETECVRFFN